MLDKLNLFIIIISTSVILVILYDLYTDFNEFKKEYEEEQEEKDEKLQGLFKSIDDNDSVLNNKQGEFSALLTTQEKNILENRELVNEVSQSLTPDTFEDLKEGDLKNLSDTTKSNLLKMEERKVLENENNNKRKEEQENKREITSKKIILNVDTPNDLEVCYKNPDNSTERICRKIILEGEPSFIKNNDGYTLQTNKNDENRNARFKNKNKKGWEEVTLHYK
jgi:hypothetical protein